ncbi:MAG: NAD(P)H-dependent oxidoreductase [Myxococcales bacterium]|nr:NAD(P)H-dependent oxidoreductase [Myxococcales bacterium]
MRSFLFVLSSTRVDGNSERLARLAARGLAPEITQTWLRLTDHPLEPFADTRHSTGYATPTHNAKLLCDATLAATDLVLMTPVYWYSLPWTLALYLDHWSAWMRDKELGFLKAMEGRALHAIVVDSDDDAAGSSLPVIDTLRRTADYMKMTWPGALVGHGNRPGDVEQDTTAIAAATTYFT